MNRKAIYEVWRGEGHPWVSWVKPSLLHSTPSDSGGPAERDAAYRAESPPWARLDTSWLPERAALIVDLPGDSAVSLALATGQRGVRPVLAINACSEAGELIAMGTVLEMLAIGARFPSAFPTGPSVAPAFILDSRRDAGGRRPSPGSFDNRWAVFRSDLPEAEDLRRAGIARVVVVQAGPTLHEDIAAVLRAYRAGRLDLLLHDVAQPGPSTPIAVPERSWLGELTEHFRRRFSLGPRRSDGSFGRRVLIPPEPSHG
jgi:hypothetical protein